MDDNTGTNGHTYLHPNMHQGVRGRRNVQEVIAGSGVAMQSTLIHHCTNL